MKCLPSLFLILAVATATAQETLDFNRDIKPILSSNCFSCHGPDEGHRKADLRLDTYDGATADGAVIAGNAGVSELIARITSTDPDDIMPPPKSGPALSPEQVAILEKWIDSGAGYERHWSFVKPTPAAPPAVEDSPWARNPIDQFVLARLDREGLTPRPKAEPAQLLRRLHLDLTGLPPQPEDVRAFIADPDVEKAVDRLLASPAFGEHWAAPWLDLARYADSMGYASDNLRTIWAYRDWVIDSINANQPFDEFTRDQMAGDLVPNATKDQVIATAFHRNTMNNTEGGTDNEEFRVAAVKDRVNTTLQTWMGLTMRCAECHTHKYDPITHTEYYQFFDFFNQTADRDTNDDKPVIAVPGSLESEQRVAFQTKIDAASARLNAYDAAALAKEQTEWEARYRGESKWRPLEFSKMDSNQDATFEQEADQAIFVSGKSGKNDTYRLAVEATDLKTITGFRLETLPDPRLPSGGAGRSPEGRFFLNRIAAFHDTGTASPSARYVRISLPQKTEFLALAEVEVFAGTTNIARQGKATQSSTYPKGEASRAIDGITNGDFTQNPTSHTQKDAGAWWELDLGAMKPIDRLVLWNRTDGVRDRLDGYTVQLLDAARTPVWESPSQPAPKVKAAFEIDGVSQLLFSEASATFSDPEFPITAAIGQHSHNNKGWDPTPRHGEPLEATFVLKAPYTPSPDATLRIELSHDYNFGGQLTLGKFRLSATDDPALARRGTLPPDILTLIDRPVDQRSESDRTKLLGYFRGIAPSLSKLRNEIAALQKQRDQITVPTVPVLEELPTDQQRETFVQLRGSFRDLGDKIPEPRVLASFHPFPEGAPANRLGVAQWLMHPDNPLTGRVAANRIWGQLFGVGLVETAEDFGAQGTYPSHPKLLDWLATEYPRLGWDRKAMIKTIVLSATYQQSSAAPPEAFERDPDNRLLARGPRFRLSAEQVRDQALALSGLLAKDVGGPSVYPPQPPGMWRAAFNQQRTWPTSEGPDRYRRGLYTFWRRSVPYPSMATFDAPNREICNVRRIRTNTPLQAFVTLNDPVYVEIAQALAKRILKEGGDTDESRVRYALSLVKVDPPSDPEVRTVLTLLKGERSQFGYDLEAAKTFGGDVETAAWTSISNILLNLDAVMTKS